MSTGYRLSRNLVSRTSESTISETKTFLCRCGPCHAIAPAYESLSKQYPNVNFLKCDVDVATDVASRYSISAMQVFELFIELTLIFMV